MKQNFHKGSHDTLLGQDASEENESLFSAELNVSSQTPPAFIICASDDSVVNSIVLSIMRHF